jgi:transcriptional regulator of acetoin/glycerol metabolism
MLMTKLHRDPASALPVPSLRGLVTPAEEIRASEAGRDQDYDEGQTIRAWEVFVASGHLDPTQALVRATIRKSWERSATLGVDARGQGSLRATSDDRLQRLREDNESLLVPARDAIRRIGAVLVEAAAMAVITDSAGTILEVGGNRHTIESAHEIRLEVGAQWSESVAGTNGIGTALVTGEPVHVHAAEHFCQGVKAWACVGAPIHDPLDGRVIGLIDLSGPQHLFQRQSMALAVLSATQIEQALAHRLAEDRMRLLEATVERLHGSTHGEGVVVLDRSGRILHFSDAARRAWSALDLPNPLRISEQVWDCEHTTKDGTLASHLPKALHGQSLEPLVVDGAVRGAMLVLRNRPRPAAAVVPPPPGGPMIDAARSAIVGTSPVLLQAIDRLVRAARGRTTVLLEGETGVGKELFARLAHAVVKKTGKEPFVALNCGAFSKDLLGGELFGHAPGAFTGATREGRAGRFELASGGTLSLDEIGEMPLDLQPYLLRALEERAVYRLGDSKPHAIDVQLIASTNRNLKSEVEEGHFRRDLYYRIATVRITIPPLRDRTGDVLLLFSHFNARLSQQHGRDPLHLDPAVGAFLESYDWPGNVRELRNLVEGLVLMSSSDRVGFDDLPEEMLDRRSPRRPPRAPMTHPQDSAVSPSCRLQDAERRAIQQAVAEAGGNISVAADKLGVARSTIYRKLQHYKGRPPQ